MFTAPPIHGYGWVAGTVLGNTPLRHAAASNMRLAEEEGEEEGPAWFVPGNVMAGGEPS